MTLPSLPEVPREGRRTATVVAVAAGTGLCLLALVLGVKGLFADSDSASRPVPPLAGTTSRPAASAPATSEPASAPPTATSTTPATKPPADRVAFSSPSHNISCTLDSGGARCDIRQRDWKPPAEPASCTSSWGQGLIVTARGAGLVCADNTLSQGKKLGYGSKAVRGDVSCVSSKDGMRCEHGPSGHGFEIAKASYKLF